ncbi:hypothetical protein J6V86_00150 [bacterium]|nr:hypothetical protein [bacterium]
MIVQSPVNVLPHVLFHPLNVYVYCCVAAAGVAVTVVFQIVNVFELVEIDVP